MPPQMVQDLDFAVKVVGLPLVREADGLAMSSRNVRLTPDERRRALCIHDGLCAVAAAVEKGELATAPHVASVKAGITAAGGVVDYVEVRVVHDRLDQPPIERFTHHSVVRCFTAKHICLRASHQPGPSAELPAIAVVLSRARQLSATRPTDCAVWCQAVDAMSLQTVDSVSKPTVFVVAAKFGTVRLIDNMVVGEAS
jgi:pantothenate synthetase